VAIHRRAISMSAVEYIPEVATAAIDCYTDVNTRSPELERSLEPIISAPVGWTGLAPMSTGYDAVAWKAIRAGQELGRRGKALMIWTEPKPREVESH
jgi:hypothetical protein